MKTKIRVDELTVKKGFASSLKAALPLIMAGEIRLGDRVFNKPGELISPSANLEYKPKHCRWVSKGGLKLEKAFKTFGLTAKGLRCLDIGASTGGFTDVLLFNEAAEVYAVDVGYGQLDAKIANDPRVIIKDRTNFRLLPDNAFGEKFDIATADVSFISLRQILIKAAAMLKDNGFMVFLIKPQFEAEKHEIPRGGVITDKAVHYRIVIEIKNFAAQNAGLLLTGLTQINRVDKRKNLEFLALFKKHGVGLSDEDIFALVCQDRA